MSRLEAEANQNQIRPIIDGARAPKLPNFVDGKDELDSYLQHFERFATNVGWVQGGWAS